MAACVRSWPLVVWALASIVGCGDAGRSDPFPEAEAQGLTRFFDSAAPVATTQPEPGVLTYEFDPADGPQCLTGEPYRFSVRDQGSRDLMLFLQGGGACWSELCLAIVTAPAGIAHVDVLDVEKPTNPFRDTSVVYLPYCDGSMFAGQAERDTDGDGTPDRIWRGLQNLSVTLDLAARQFPSPRRIYLVGSSGGSYGTIPATILVRKKWPDAEIRAVEDAGLGIARPADPSFVNGLLSELGAADFIPDTCVDCTGDGHITRLVAWELERDPKLSVQALGAFEDYVIGDVFLGIGGAAYGDAVATETGRLAERFPARYKRFLVDGREHTLTLGNITGITGSDFGALLVEPRWKTLQLLPVQLGGIDTAVIDGTPLAAWLDAMIRDDPRVWRDLVATR